ncbi:MAG: nickel pincer cofactor biosynthesis protein LarB [Candidatus Margulisiibacteriota bacterium]
MKSRHYEDLGFAKVDHHRHQRKGFPEVIYCAGKTPRQVAEIAKKIWSHGHDVLATRADRKAFTAVRKVIKAAQYHETAGVITALKRPRRSVSGSLVTIVTAGTADLPVAEEAAVTAAFLGLRVERLFDVGVAGIHRLFSNLDKLKKARVIIVVAGMEGALPSVLGGVIDKPIIAVPTSVGYGASFKGLSALLTMLNACSPGIAVVNIDNGFGAAVMAYYIAK